MPIQKCSKFNNNIFKNKMYIPIRSFSTFLGNSINNNGVNLVKMYEDVFKMKKEILKENKGKSGIYMLSNQLTNEIYIGQSVDISKRFRNYLNLNYIKSRNKFIISRALIKYGYSNFSLIIMEYCDKLDLTIREQYYLNKLNPQYNILKIAGSSWGFKHSEETKRKISQSLKGIYVKEKSALFGRKHTEETNKLRSFKKLKEKSPIFGKIHNKDTLNLIREKALGIKYSKEAKLKMSAVRGNPVNIYEKCSSEGFKLIGNFVSVRRASVFLNVSHNTIRRYINSGEVFKERYKFSSK